MPTPDVTVKQGNTAPSISATLQDAVGAAVDLTGASVTFRMKPLAGGPVAVDHAAVIVGAALGTVRYDWQVGDTDTPGYYYGEFRVLWASGGIQSFPSDDFVLVLVKTGLV